MEAAVLTAEEWNRRHRVGVPVLVTLANGNVLSARTASPAARVGQHDMLQLEGRQGFWLLSWCRALEMPAGAMPEGE